MPSSFIPQSDSLASVWFANFASVLAANPATYGLTAGDAAAVSAAQATFAADYATATTSTTRTPDSIAAKDTARNQLSVLVRAYAAIIQANQGVSQSDRTALGLPIHKTTHTRVPVPATAPTIEVLAQSPNVAKVSYHNPDVGQKIKAKPPGVKFCEYAFTASTTVITDPEVLGMRTLAARTPFNLSLSGVNSGQRVYVAARWINTRGEFGPWSTIEAFNAM